MTTATLPRSRKRDALNGLAAGAAGVWALDRVTWFLWNRESPDNLAREVAARPEGMDPAHLLTHRTAAALGLPLERRQPHPAAIGLHYLFASVPVALYAALRPERLRDRGGTGALLGVALFLLQDEWLNRVLKTAGPARAYPWQAHARGLVGHVTYAVVAIQLLRALDRFETGRRARVQGA